MATTSDRFGFEETLKRSEHRTRANGTARLSREQRMTPEEFLAKATAMPQAIAPSRAYMVGIQMVVRRGHSMEEAYRQASEASGYSVMTLRDMYKKWRKEQRA